MPDPLYDDVLPHPALTKAETKEELIKHQDSELLLDAILINAGIMKPTEAHDRKWAIEFMRSH